MSVWGIGVRIEGGNPVVEAIEITDSGVSLAPRPVLIHRCEFTDRARALMLLANDLEHELSKKAPAAIVVRAMDWFHARRENVARPRLQVEGVLLASARRVVPDAAAMSGKEIADLLGISKGELEAEATRILPGVNKDVGMAALGARALAERSASR